VLFFDSKDKKERKELKEWALMVRKVYDYRHDILPTKDREALTELLERVESLFKDKTSPIEGLRIVQNEGDPLLRRCGGYLYPKTFIADNAEMLLFAAILAIGIRSFFFQPFKIPTNSMYPTYNGMTAAAYVEEAPPNRGVQALRLITLGAKQYRIVAPTDGELSFSPERQLVPGRKWFILPTQKFRYTFYVGESPVTVDLPLEFDVRQVLGPLFADRARSMGKLPSGKEVLRTGIQVYEGDVAFAFDLLTGDQLFVDRFTYHFRPPRVGDPIVFRTDNIPGMDADNVGKYYIKRAVAGPGDTLEIEPPGLLVNGEEPTGSPAFARNREQVDNYSGYVFAGPTQNYPRPFFDGEGELTLPEKSYFAMGDNSPNSADSRMWGLVPQREIVGRAFLIYYPFSHRWGLAE
jgi:signal peptidase I